MSEANTKQQDTAHDAAAAEPDEKPPERDPVRKWTLVTLAIIGVMLCWYLGADRFTPFSSQARVAAYVVPIAPQVGGNVLSVEVENNQIVEQGDVLLTLDDSNYTLALIRAESDLEQAQQQLGASSAGVESAAARVAATEAELVRARKDFERMQRIRAEEPGAISQRRLDLAEASLKAAESQVASTRADLEGAKQKRGREGVDNAQVQAALSALNQARLDLERTRVRAPAGGLVTDLQLEIGNLAQPGKPLMTFVGIKDVWIQADMRENNLEHIKEGDPVGIALDVHPGRIVMGRVRSIGFGVDAGTSTALGSLPTITNDRNWLRDAQQFPVIIELDETSDLGLRIGSQATVMVYTENSFLLVPIGKLYMRLVTLFSYLY